MLVIQLQWTYVICGTIKQLDTTPTTTAVGVGVSSGLVLVLVRNN